MIISESTRAVSVFSARRALAPCLLLLAACAAEPPPVAVGGATGQRCFHPRVIDASGAGADGVHMGDINGDGYADVVSGWEESGRLRVYLHPGANIGAWRRPWPSVDAGGGAALGAIEDAAFVDLDADGALDAVVSATEGMGGTRNRRIRLHRWDRDRPLAAAQSWDSTVLYRDAPGDRFLAVRGAQLDGRHGADIVALSRDLFEDPDDSARITTPGGVFLYLAPPPRQVSVTEAWTRRRLADVHKGKSLHLLDMDADGDTDILYGGARNIVWVENPLHEPSARPWQTHWVGTASDLAVCDINGDGNLDIVGTASRKEYPVVARWFEGIADPSRRHRSWRAHDIRIEPPLPFRFYQSENYSVKGIACGRMLGASGAAPDIVLTTSGSGFGLFLASAPADFPADATAPWRAAPLVPYRWLMKYDNVLARDLDGDGDLDLVTTEENTGWLARGAGVLWYENRPARQDRCPAD